MGTPSKVPAFIEPWSQKNSGYLEEFSLELQKLTELFIPFQKVNVEKHRLSCICYICTMDTAMGSSCQAPNKPWVNGPKKRSIFLNCLLNFSHVVRKPTKFHCAEVSASGRPVLVLTKLLFTGMLLLRLSTVDWVLRSSHTTALYRGSQLICPISTVVSLWLRTNNFYLSWKYQYWAVQVSPHVFSIHSYTDSRISLGSCSPILLGKLLFISTWWWLSSSAVFELKTKKRVERCPWSLLPPTAPNCFLRGCHETSFSRRAGERIPFPRWRRLVGEGEGDGKRGGPRGAQPQNALSAPSFSPAPSTSRLLAWTSTTATGNRMSATKSHILQSPSPNRAHRKATLWN